MFVFPTRLHVRPAKTRISLYIRAVRSESTGHFRCPRIQSSFMRTAKIMISLRGRSGRSESSLGAPVILTLQKPRKPASENVVCLCRLLNILANFSNLILHTGKQCGPRSDCSLFAEMTFKITIR